MRLVAVDPGSYDCGLAMWEGEDLCRLHTLRARGRLGVRRAGVVLAGIEAWLDEWRPEVLVVENRRPTLSVPCRCCGRCTTAYGALHASED